MFRWSLFALNCHTALGLLAISNLAIAQSISSGSGFVFNELGDVLTNSHVIRGCETVSVRIANSTTEARVLGRDEKNDVAVIRSRPTSNFLQFRSEPRLKLGESVVVVGYPLSGLLASSMSLTAGTLSALAGIGDDSRMLQFTAPIQPGNSGGPLLDQGANVIGIVTSKLSPLWTAQQLGDIPQNVNFAIKSSVARDFMDSKAIDYRVAASTSAFDNPTIGDRVKNSIASIECLKPHTSPQLSPTPDLSAIGGNDKRNTEVREMQKSVAAFLGARLRTWTLNDARSTLGSPSSLAAGVYRFGDPTHQFEHLELRFDIDSTFLSHVNLFPVHMTWQECKQVWGENATAMHLRDGIVQSYNDRRLNVYLDKNDNVISLGLY